MPKIMKDIEKKILNSAIELFKEKGYENADMRTIAKENKIAVGTLYNYYSSKKQLFIRALEESWKDTLYKLEKIVESDGDYKDRIVMYVKELYYGFISRNGLGKELILVEIFDSVKETVAYENKENTALKKLENIFFRLIENLEVLIKEGNNDGNYNISRGEERRFAIMLIASTRDMIMQYPDEDEKNIEFIKQIIYHTFSNKVRRLVVEEMK